MGIWLRAVVAVMVGLTAAVGVPGAATAAPAQAGGGNASRPGGLEFGEPVFLTPLRQIGFTQVSSAGISGDGSVIVFASDRPDLIRVESPYGDVIVQVEGVRVHPYPDSAMVGPGGQRYWAACARVSRDGRYVMFCSNSPRLVPGDTNEVVDTFVYDRLTSSIERINVATSGAQATSLTRSAAISADGQFVVFTSGSANLVAEDTNNSTDVFVRDRVARTTTRVSVSSTGRQGNSVSGVADDVRLAISGDGRFVVFDSWANNLVPGDTNKIIDTFLRDRRRGTTDRVNVDDHGQQMTWNPVFKRATSTEVDTVSDDGRYVAFTSEGTGIGGVAPSSDHNLDQFLRDRFTGTTRLVSQRDGKPAGTYPASAFGGQLTPDGRLMTFRSNSAVLSPFSTNFVIYAYEVATGRLSRAPGPALTPGFLTSDGHTMLYLKTDPSGDSSVLAKRSIS